MFGGVHVLFYVSSPLSRLRLFFVRCFSDINWRKILYTDTIHLSSCIDCIQITHISRQFLLIYTIHVCLRARVSMRCNENDKSSRNRVLLWILACIFFFCVLVADSKFMDLVKISLGTCHMWRFSHIFLLT